MKYTFGRTTFLMVFAIIISIGNLSCDSQPPPPPPTTPAQKWVDWVKSQERIGRTVVDATESQLWLAKHSDKVSLPDKIGFMDQHLLMEPDFLIYGVNITVDHNHNYRVIAKEWPLPHEKPGYEPPNIASLKEMGYKVLSAEASREWLKENSYHVEKKDKTCTITRNYVRPGYSDTSTTSISDSGISSLSVGAMITLDHKGEPRVAVRQ